VYFFRSEEVFFTFECPFVLSMTGVGKVRLAGQIRPAEVCFPPRWGYFSTNKFLFNVKMSFSVLAFSKVWPKVPPKNLKWATVQKNCPPQWLVYVWPSLLFDKLRKVWGQPVEKKGINSSAYLKMVRVFDGLLLQFRIYFSIVMI